MGMQWAPLLADTVLLDTGSEVGYTFRVRTSHPSGDGLRQVHLDVAIPPPGLPARKELLVNLYPAGQVAGTGPVRKLVIPMRDGTLLSGAALAGGASMPQDAVQNSSDPRHVTRNTCRSGPGGSEGLRSRSSERRRHRYNCRPASCSLVPGSAWISVHQVTSCRQLNPPGSKARS